MAVTRNLRTNVKITVSPTSGQVRLSEDIAWSSVPARLGEIFGPTTSSGIVATEIDPLFGLWRAQSVDIVPKCEAQIDSVAGGAAGDVIMPVFSEARLDITYASIEQESPTSQQEADQDGEGDPVPFLTHTWGIGGDFITMDNSSMYWSSKASAQATGIAANKIIPTIEHSINWKRVLNPPFEEIRRCLGKVNSKTMTFSTGKIYPETLLFNGAELSRDIMSDGTRAWDMTYRFSERRVSAGPVTVTTAVVALGGGSNFEVEYGVFDGVGPTGVGYTSAGAPARDTDGDGTIDESIYVTQSGIDALTAYGVTDTGGIHGGWNHFFKKDKPSGMFRLHMSSPSSSAPSSTVFFSRRHQYVEEEAIYKKYDLLKLFEQNP